MARAPEKEARRAKPKKGLQSLDSSLSADRHSRGSEQKKSEKCAARLAADCVS
jgi:hypothetical protein